MTAKKNVAIAPELLEQADKVARAEGKTVDEFTAQAVQREIARRTLERLRAQGEQRRLGMTDEDVERTVERAVQESRLDQRGR
jgi:fructose-1,6-bisphosphatase/sedoheptulose 1,7-bisphosphatase-like protein